MNPAVEEEVLNQSTGSYFHACGTCALGTVVDPALNVPGVTGLRVTGLRLTDASVRPTLIGANSNGYCCRFRAATSSLSR
ncbi:GMC oxidoreductase [Amycolatopsis sp. NPDC023774]|uniref:GMC oxidoreductase n=1 Tax=Amycolatopsis sp. NPDC023774 TaxID=3155015 RepID=UPI0033F2F05E